MRPHRYHYFRRSNRVDDQKLAAVAADIADLYPGSRTGDSHSTTPPASPPQRRREPQPAAHRMSLNSVQYRFAEVDADGLPVTWGMSSPITVVLVPDGMGYPTFVRDAVQAIKKVAVASDFPIRLMSHEGKGLDDASICIRWVPDRTWLKSADKQALASAEITTHTSQGHKYIVHAEVRLRADVRRKPGFVAHGWGPVLLHELIHCLGGQHCTDPRQIMHPTSDDVGDLGLGDRLCIRLLTEAARRKERR